MVSLGIQVVFAVQASSITEGSAGTCGVGDPGEQAVSASSVGRQWAVEADRESLMENDPLASGQSVGFLRWCCLLSASFCSVGSSPAFRLITSPSYFLLTYCLLALNFSLHCIIPTRHGRISAQKIFSLFGKWD